MKNKSARKGLFLSAAAFLLSFAFCPQIVYAQRPEQDEPPSLLTRNCDSRYFYAFEQKPTISIGREVFYPTFYITTSYDSETGYLTCNLASSTSNAPHPTLVRLQFGLSDSSSSDTRASVTAYIDGKRWGSVNLAPMQPSQVWLLEVQDASSVSLEVECIAVCVSYPNSRVSQKVYFARAELEYLGSEALSSPSQEGISFPSGNSSGSEIGDARDSERSPRASNSEQSSSGSTGSLADAIHSIREIIDIFN
jgi:hypothetical protein